MHRIAQPIAAVAIACLLAAAAFTQPAHATVIEDRIAALLKKLDQPTWEIHKRCYGFQMGVYTLLTRLKPFVAASDTKTLDGLIERYGPKEMYGVNEGFYADHNVAFDKAAGEKAYEHGRLEWGAQALLPPDQQYAYFAKYGKPPADCEEAYARIEEVRTPVWRYEFERDLYGKDFVPPTDSRHP